MSAYSCHLLSPPAGTHAHVHTLILHLLSTPSPMRAPMLMYIPRSYTYSPPPPPCGHPCSCTYLNPTPTATLHPLPPAGTRAHVHTSILHLLSTPSSLRAPMLMYIPRSYTYSPPPPPCGHPCSCTYLDPTPTLHPLLPAGTHAHVHTSILHLLSTPSSLRAPMLMYIPRSYTYSPPPPPCGHPCSCTYLDPTPTLHPLLPAGTHAHIHTSIRHLLSTPSPLWAPVLMYIPRSYTYSPPPAPCGHPCSCTYLDPTPTLHPPPPGTRAHVHTSILHLLSTPCPLRAPVLMYIPRSYTYSPPPPLRAPMLMYIPRSYTYFLPPPPCSCIYLDPTPTLHPLPPAGTRAHVHTSILHLLSTPSPLRAPVLMYIPRSYTYSPPPPPCGHPCSCTYLDPTPALHPLPPAGTHAHVHTSIRHLLSTPSPLRAPMLMYIPRSYTYSPPPPPCGHPCSCTYLNPTPTLHPPCGHACSCIYLDPTPTLHPLPPAHVHTSILHLLSTPPPPCGTRAHVHTSILHLLSTPSPLRAPMLMYIPRSYTYSPPPPPCGHPCSCTYLDPTPTLHPLPPAGTRAHVHTSIQHLLSTPSPLRAPVLMYIPRSDTYSPPPPPCGHPCSCTYLDPTPTLHLLPPAGTRAHVHTSILHLLSTPPCGHACSCIYLDPTPTLHPLPPAGTRAHVHTSIQHLLSTHSPCAHPCSCTYLDPTSTLHPLPPAGTRAHVHTSILHLLSTPSPLRAPVLMYIPRSNTYSPPTPPCAHPCSCTYLDPTPTLHPLPPAGTRAHVHTSILHLLSTPSPLRAPVLMYIPRSYTYPPPCGHPYSCTYLDPTPSLSFNNVVFNLLLSLQMNKQYFWK